MRVFFFLFKFYLREVVARTACVYSRERMESREPLTQNRAENKEQRVSTALFSSSLGFILFERDAADLE